MDRFLKVCSITGQQHFIASSEIEVPPQQQRPTAPPPSLATTTANSDGVDVRQQKNNTVEPGRRIQQKKKRCTGTSVLGSRKTVYARLKKKARTARLPASRRGSHTLPESGRRQAMVALHDKLREQFQPEDSEISAKVKSTLLQPSTLHSLGISFLVAICSAITFVSQGFTDRL